MKNLKFNFKSKKSITLIALVIVMLLILIMLGIYKGKNIKIDNLIGKKLKENNEEKISYRVYSNKDDIYKSVVIVKNNVGIERINYNNDENILFCDGKTQVAFDYNFEKDIQYKFNVTYSDGTVEEKNITIDEETINKIIPITETSALEPEAMITLDIDYSWYTKKQYRIASNDWTNYTNPITLKTDDIISNKWNNDDNQTFTISVKGIDKDENEVIIDRKIDIVKWNERNNILENIIKQDIPDGEYDMTIRDETYNMEVINYYDDVVYSEDTFLGNDTSDERMLVVKYHKNLTIDDVVKITPTTRKKGMYICVLGDLENNGEITMTARGASAEGQTVYLHQEKIFNAYDKIDAVGAKGADRVSDSYWFSGKKGADATRRNLGGGGSGGMYHGYGTGSYPGHAISGAGGNGTSYSGGSGGGSVTNYREQTQGGDGSSTGGSGGIAYGLNGAAGGGAGNPGGDGGDGGSSGENGTGGLLILYGNNIINNGKITADGSKGGFGTVTAGGSSGGGSVNVFYKQSITKGVMTANGGEATIGTTKGNGGAGGNGTITITQIP